MHHEGGAQRGEGLEGDKGRNAWSPDPPGLLPHLSVLSLTGLCSALRGERLKNAISIPDATQRGASRSAEGSRCAAPGGLSGIGRL